MKVKKIALIGIGYWGKVYLKYLSFNKKSLIKRIYYRNNKPNIKEFKLPQKVLTNNLNDILKDKDINFVNVVTPIQTHAELVIKFLKNNKNVLVEKPLVMNQIQKNKINRLLKHNKIKLLVSYPYLFSKTLSNAKKIVNSKNLGSIKFIDINILQCGRFMKYDVNHLLGPHAISILGIFFNINNIKFEINKIISNNKKCETVFVKCTQNSKMIGSINLSLNYANTTNKKLVNIYLKNGIIVCDLNNKKHTLSSFTYSRTKKDSYKVANVKNQINKFYDEKNNMRDVIDNFYLKKNDNYNFVLTKKINEFLNNV